MYVSTSTGLPNANMMDEIMKVAQAHNSSAGTTGFLISRNFTFVQFLEGPPEALDSPMESIRNDGRHHSIEVLIDEPATSRRFPKWSMTYRLLAPGSANPLRQRVLGCRRHDRYPRLRRDLRSRREGLAMVGRFSDIKSFTWQHWNDPRLVNRAEVSLFDDHLRASGTQTCASYQARWQLETVPESVTGRRGEAHFLLLAR